MAPVSILVYQPCHSSLRTAHQFKHPFLPQILNNLRQGEQRLLEQIDAAELLSSSLQWLKIRRDHSYWTHLSQTSFSIVEITAGRKVVFSSPTRLYIHIHMLCTRTQRFKPWYSFQTALHKNALFFSTPPPHTHTHFICGRHEECW